MLARQERLLIGQVGFVDRSDDRAVMADRAILNSHPAEPQRFHRGTWNPDRREQMTSAAPDHDVATEAVSAKPQSGPFKDERNEEDDRKPSSNAGSFLRRTASTSLQSDQTRDGRPSSGGTPVEAP